MQRYLLVRILERIKLTTENTYSFINFSCFSNDLVKRSFFLATFILDILKLKNYIKKNFVKIKLTLN